jgi:hypothetical protein
MGAGKLPPQVYNAAEREAQMGDWLAGYIEGKQQGLEAAARHFERNINGSFDSRQVATILRAFAEIEEKIGPDPIDPQSKIWPLSSF